MFLWLETDDDLMARKRRKIKHKGSRNLGLIAFILAFMLISVGLHSRQLWQRKVELEKQKAQLESQIQSEELRTQELVQLKKYVQTDSYAQEVAQDQLGLVHEGEIVFEIEK